MYNEWTISTFFVAGFGWHFHARRFDVELEVMGGFQSAEGAADHAKRSIDYFERKPAPEQPEPDQDGWDDVLYE